jgi:hypothetical protein
MNNALSPSFLSEPYNLYCIPTIGTIGVRWLCKLGIQTIQELAQQSTDELVQRFRQQGIRFSACEVGRWIAQAQQRCQSFPNGLHDSRSHSRPIPVFSPLPIVPIAHPIQPEPKVMESVESLEPLAASAPVDVADTNTVDASITDANTANANTADVNASDTNIADMNTVENTVENTSENIVVSTDEIVVTSANPDANPSEDAQHPESPEPLPFPPSTHRTIALQVIDTEQSRQLNVYYNHADQMTRWQGQSLVEFYHWLEEQLGADPRAIASAANSENVAEATIAAPSEPIRLTVDGLELAQPQQFSGWMAATPQNLFLTELMPQELFSLKAIVAADATATPAQLRCETRHLETGEVTQLLEGQMELLPIQTGSHAGKWAIVAPNLNIPAPGLYRLSLSLQLANGAIAHCKIPALQVIASEAECCHGTCGCS